MDKSKRRTRRDGFKGDLGQRPIVLLDTNAFEYRQPSREKYSGCWSTGDVFATN